MFLNILRSLAGSMKVLLIAGTLGLLSMTVSFSVVHYVTRDAVPTKYVDPVLVRRANMLRDFSNELVTLCNGYARRIPSDPTKASQNDRLWVEKVFRSELQYLQQRMDETIREDTPESVQLEGSAARCAAMARRASDGEVRAATLREVATTINAIETWIAAEGLDMRLSRFPVAIQFY